ncbi:histidine phosphatase family protein [Pseudoroseomonas rhizosphaerae]|uniref:Histidine phosphatase family protein n=1 Tax=Teichococcus rhizosphaerae TaxID=1335062 RepID=A0A2C7A6U9_9PROT|nr:histidine phosphatase family protein [Pseudoroseomonas rhizosphaerae]PHK93343.1 histidine phosphatase family protein [Pseudoroseomonas rhizosphaerae]
MQPQWPARLWIARHGESAGNVARAAAMAARQAMIDIAERDVDVPLSPLGEQQSRALGRWFAEQPPEARPEIILASPYRRARHTAELIRAEALPELGPRGFILDERLREKEFGVLDRLTSHGISQRHPDQVEFRRILGKFYHRPPGGESWCDVILRLRSALDSLCLHHGGRRVLIVGHQVVVLCLRYLLEGLTEERILEIDREGDIANCGLTEYAFEPGGGEDGAMRLRRYNWTAPLEAGDTPVTAQPHGGAPR